jgi:hypothetical protein
MSTASKGAAIIAVLKPALLPSARAVHLLSPTWRSVFALCLVPNTTSCARAYSRFASVSPIREVCPLVSARLVYPVVRPRLPVYSLSLAQAVCTHPARPLLPLSCLLFWLSSVSSPCAPWCQRVVSLSCLCTCLSPSQNWFPGHRHHTSPIVFLGCEENEYQFVGGADKLTRHLRTHEQFVC